MRAARLLPCCRQKTPSRTISRQPTKGQYLRAADRQHHLSAKKFAPNWKSSARGGWPSLHMRWNRVLMLRSGHQVVGTASLDSPRWHRDKDVACGAGLAVRHVEVAMATSPVASVVDAVKERLSPALDTLNETIRQGRKVVVRGQHAAEDAAAAAALRVRRRPLSAVMIATGAGALVGALVGFGLASVTRCRE